MPMLHVIFSASTNGINLKRHTVVEHDKRNWREGITGHLSKMTSPTPGGSAMIELC